MSLRDSGTKSRKFFRVLTVFAVVAALLVMTGVVAFASAEGTAETSVEQAGDVFEKSGFKKLDIENATLTEKLMYGLEIAVIGMAVVFIVLIIIMAILYIFKLFATSGEKKTSDAPQAAPAPVAVAPVAAAASDEETIVAVATAAIAAERGESECAFKVISITKLQ